MCSAELYINNRSENISKETKTEHMPTGNQMKGISKECISAKTIWVKGKVNKEKDKHLCKYNKHFLNETKTIIISNL